MTSAIDDRKNVATWCRIMQVGPPCSQPCGDCKDNGEFAHDHWRNIANDPDGVCRTCLGEDDGMKVYFNPFAFTIEENNAFLAAGYEVMPIQVPR